MISKVTAVSGPMPGLRREEVALLAGVSIDHSVRLERGNLKGVSDTVLDSLAQALQLDAAERAHLRDLPLASNSGPRRRRPSDRQQITANVQRALAAMTDVPAIVRLDIVAANPLGFALYAPMFSGGKRRPRTSPGSSSRPQGARVLRLQLGRVHEQHSRPAHTEAGMAPHDKRLTDLIGEPVTRSEEFRTTWAKHNVRLHHSGSEQFHHPAVGDLTLDFDAMQFFARPGLTLGVMSAPPGSVSEDALKLLATWAATPEEAGLAHLLVTPEA
ncbi:helix-turn-helix transcriptional regulator [Streptomyces lasalocidi]|uniref:helix-turn-helix transcriptional regulator n=1 Tax=Streptomyces lasalocidi TaxID=324833 RepID=UPI0030C85BA1